LKEKSSFPFKSTKDNCRIKREIKTIRGLFLLALRKPVLLKASAAAIGPNVPRTVSLGRFTGSIEFQGETKSVTEIAATRTYVPKSLFMASEFMDQAY
jgi:hypothetical protein